MIKKFLHGMATQRQADRRLELYRSLIRHEAKIGGQLFGSLPKGGRREFFCLDEHTWVWHEEWLDDKGQRRIKTTHYNVRPTGVVKTQNGQDYQSISDEEALRLIQAARLYSGRVKKELYNFA